MVEEWWGGAESLIQGQLKSHLFPAGILAEAISMRIFGMLYRLNISVLFSLAIAVSDFRPLEIYENLGLPLSFINFTVNNDADNYSINSFL